MAKIGKHMTRNLVAVDASAPCSEAAKLMTTREIGSVAVRKGGRIVGLVTERDLVARLLARDEPPSAPVASAMRKDQPRVPVTATEGECAERMRKHYTRHLLVEEDGKVVGVVSMRDVIRLMLDEKQFLIDQLNIYIHGR